jgi:hypothetical protein
MFLRTFLTTRQDKYLSLPLAGRDPLGSQIVWQHKACQFSVTSTLYPKGWHFRKTP